MPTLHFLEGSKPLVKSYKLDANNANEIIKTAYLNEYLFTSHEVLCTTLKDLHSALVAHAAKGHCLIKGELREQLIKQPRKGMTDGDATTEWICIDLDDAPFKTAEEFIASEPCFKDVSYVLQYSASAGLPGTPGLRAHLFFMLSNPYTAPYLKLWMKHRNLTNETLRTSLTLTKSENAIRWPLDITINQNDKLIYIAPPLLGKGVVSTIKAAERITYVAKPLLKLPIERIQFPSGDAISKDERDQINSFRKTAKLPVNRCKLRVDGEYEIQPGMGQLRMVYWEDGDWVRFNIDNGDSNAYYHPVDNFELIHNFKGEPSYLTKEVFPDYYKRKVSERKRADAAPTENGDVLMAICDKATDSYYKVFWESESYTLNLYPAKSEKRLNDFMENHGKLAIEIVPQWDVVFEPHNDVIIDHDERKLNTFVPSAHYRSDRNPSAKLTDCPTIYNVMRHAVSSGQDSPVFEHWMNWLACIVQHRIKTTTAWVLSGVSSTGKGLISHILMQLMGEAYVQSRDFEVMEDSFNAWMERTLVVILEETQVEASTKMKMITGKLKHLISEPTAPMRAMHSVSRQVKNYTNFIFTSNYRNPVFIDPSDDRYNFGDYQTKSILDTFPTYTREYLVKHMAMEIPAFFEYLIHRKACINTAGLVIENATRQNVLENSGDSISDLANALLTGDLDPFVATLPDMRAAAEMHGANPQGMQAIAYNDIVQRELRALITEGGASTIFKKGATRKEDKAVPAKSYVSKLTRDELNILFQFNVGSKNDTPAKFSRMLGHRNVKIQVLSVNGKSVRGIYVTWQMPLTWCEQYAEEMEVPKLKRVK